MRPPTRKRKAERQSGDEIVDVKKHSIIYVKFIHNLHSHQGRKEKVSRQCKIEYNMIP